MNRTLIMRIALWGAAFFSLVAALLLLFPTSLGEFAQLPPVGSFFYSWFLVLFIVLFGGAYGWLAMRAEIARPLVALAAVGKTGAFAVALTCWLLGEVPRRIVAFAAGDLVFAAIFCWWLLSPPTVHQGSEEV